MPTKMPQKLIISEKKTNNLLLKVWCSDEWADNVPNVAVFEITDELKSKLSTIKGFFDINDNRLKGLVSMTFSDYNITFIENYSKSLGEIDVYEIHKPEYLKKIDLDNIDKAARLEMLELVVDKYGFSWRGYLKHTSLLLTTDSVDWSEILG
jgi:hypothetical protein